MILLTYSRLRQLVLKRKWFFHCWQLKYSTDKVNGNVGWMTPHSYLKDASEEAKYYFANKYAFAFRVMGVEVSVIIN